jgi:hypothetical protein
MTPVKFGRNPTSSLTFEGRTRFFIFLVLVAILCNEAEPAGDVHNKEWH